MCVNIATGEMTLQATDFQVPGLLPFALERSYSSRSRSRKGSLGYGWSANLGQGVRVEVQGITLVAADGEERRIVDLPAGGQTTLDRGSLIARQVARSETAVTMTGPGKRRLVFGPIRRGDPWWPLLQQSDFNGNTIQFQYRDDGLLETVVDTLRRRLEFEHNRRGLLTAVDLVLPEAKRLRLAAFDYDGRDNLIQTSDATKATWTYEYQDHLIVRMTNPLGGTTSFEYDEHGRCITTWLDGGKLYRRFDFDDRRHTTLVTDSYGFRSLYRFNPADLCEERIDPLGEIKRSYYDASFQRIATEDEQAGDGSLIQFDPERRQLIRTEANGSTWCFTLDELNQIIEVTDPCGHTTTLEHDQRGNRISQTSPLGHRWRFSYDARGRLATATDPTGQVVRIEYDPSDRLIIQRDELGILNSYHFDFLGNLDALADARGRETTIRSDARGRLLRLSYPDGSGFVVQRDSMGNITSIRNAVGSRWVRRYDSQGRIIGSTDPLGHAVEIQYDLEYRPVAVVNERGERAVLEYDPAGRLTRLTSFDGRVEEFKFNARGEPIEVTDSDGTCSRMEYDELGRLVKKTYSDGSTASLGYDGMGRIVEVVNRWGEVHLEYDADGRLVAENQPGGLIHHAYDASGRLTEIRWRDQFIAYRYDLRGRIVQIRTDDETVVELDHAPDGSTETVRAPSGARIRSEFDPLGRLLRREATDPGGTMVWGCVYSYDRAGRLETAVDLVRGRRRSYDHDAADQILAVVVDGREVERYCYDPAGNLESDSQGGVAEIGSGNRLRRLGTLELEYDARGHAVGRTLNDQRLTLVYDPAGYCIEAAGPDGSATRFAYDGFARRFRKSRGGRDTAFLWSGPVLLEARENDAVPTSFVFLPHNLHPFLARAGETLLYVNDPLGTPRALLEATGAGRLRWEAEAGTAYGDQREPPVTPATSIRFLGQYADAETGLCYHRTRYYDPAARRYLAPDRLGFGGGLNLYAFVRNSPLNLVDPLGLACFRQECEDLYQQMDNLMNTRQGSPPPHPGAGYQAPHGHGLVERGEQLVANHGRQPVERLPGDPLGQTMTVASHWQQWWNMQGSLIRQQQQWYEAGCTPANTSNPAAAQSVQDQAATMAVASAPNPTVVGDPAAMNGIAVWNPSSGIPDPGIPF